MSLPSSLGIRGQARPCPEVSLRGERPRCPRVVGFIVTKPRAGGRPRRTSIHRLETTCGEMPARSRLPSSMESIPGPRDGRTSSRRCASPLGPPARGLLLLEVFSGTALRASEGRRRASRERGAGSKAAGVSPSLTGDSSRRGAFARQGCSGGWVLGSSLQVSLGSASGGPLDPPGGGWGAAKAAADSPGPRRPDRPRSSSSGAPSPGSDRGRARSPGRGERATARPRTGSTRFAASARGSFTIAEADERRRAESAPRARARGCERGLSHLVLLELSGDGDGGGRG